MFPLSDRIPVSTWRQEVATTRTTMTGHRLGIDTLYGADNGVRAPPSCLSHSHISQDSRYSSPALSDASTCFINMAASGHIVSAGNPYSVLTVHLRPRSRLVPVSRLPWLRSASID